MPTRIDHNPNSRSLMMRAMAHGNPKAISVRDEGNSRIDRMLPRSPPPIGAAFPNFGPATAGSFLPGRCCLAQRRGPKF
jgi:hypothetical protein